MFDKHNQRILVDIPLTGHTSKIRVKSRSMFYEYGTYHATRRNVFTQNNYIEWQIGYDVEIKKKEMSSLPDISFTAYNGKEKVLYELSEYLYYLCSWNRVSLKDLEDISDFLIQLGENDLISNHPDCQITRTHPIEKQINNTTFYGMELKYPQLVYKFGVYEIIAEITISEKQYAVGVQPMLYLCFPITEVQTPDNLIGRIAQVKETGIFVIDESNCNIVLEMIKIFGMLSPSHHQDILQIIKAVLDNV